jgi:hypothetical protein
MTPATPHRTSPICRRTACVRITVWQYCSVSAHQRLVIGKYSWVVCRNCLCACDCICCFFWCSHSCLCIWCRGRRLHPGHAPGAWVVYAEATRTHRVAAVQAQARLARVRPCHEMTLLPLFLHELKEHSGQGRVVGLWIPVGCPMQACSKVCQNRLSGPLAAQPWCPSGSWLCNNCRAACVVLLLAVPMY